MNLLFAWYQRKAYMPPIKEEKSDSWHIKESEPGNKWSSS
jgi:hypothetical protein